MATDGDGDRLKYSLIEYPKLMTIEEETGQLFWMPTLKYLQEQNGNEIPVLIKVTDVTGGEKLQEFKIKIRKTN